jgi:NADH:ubiquinone reductase (H+-translocating)
MIMRSPDDSARRVVILGGGFAGAYCARALEQHLGRFDMDVCLIDRHNYFVFYPLLIEAGTGIIEPRHVVIPIRSFLKTANYRRGEVTSINTTRQEVSFKLLGTDRDQVLAYEHLVIALGSITRMPRVPGLAEWGLQIKTLIDAIALRDRTISLLEMADSTPSVEERRALLHVIIAGANFTGVELAGELQSFLREAARLYKNLSPEDCRVTLIEISDRILPALDPDLASYAAQRLQGLGVRILLKRSVKAVFPQGVEMDDGQRISSHSVIWAAGVAPNPLIAKLALPVDRLGYILCERDLRVQGFQNVWAIGDCAVNPGADGRPYPATAQHALREGQALARNIAEVFRGRPALPCDISSRGSMAALGGRRAVAKVYDYKLKGFPAWFIRQTYYLTQIPGWSRKIRIALDWTLNLLFARDIVQLGIHTVPPDASVRKVA